MPRRVADTIAVEASMRFEKFCFGSIRIDHLRARRSDRPRRSPQAQEEAVAKNSATPFGHTPLSIEEDIPWNCKRLVIASARAATHRSKEAGTAKFLSVEWPDGPYTPMRRPNSRAPQFLELWRSIAGASLRCSFQGAIPPILSLHARLTVLRSRRAANEYVITPTLAEWVRP